MAVQFPASPSDAQTISVNGVTYTYSASNTRWTAGASVDLSAVAQDIIPDTDSSRSIGSATKKWQNLHASNIKSGDHLPLTDSAYNLGSPTQKWKSLFLSSNTLFLGDSGSISAGPGGTISLPSIKIGTGTAAVELTASTDGKLATKGTDASGNTEAAASESGAASSVADMAGLIALTGMTSGQTALVTSLNRIFMYTGVGWFKIADMTNETPTAITGVDASISLAADGTATTITAVSTDPEGFPLTWSHAVTTGSLGSTATVAQADNVFTVTPSTVEANAGEFSITFSVTDGATGAVNAVSAFSLSFGPVYVGDRAIVAGGRTGSEVGRTQIDYFSMPTPGNAADFGDLAQRRMETGGFSNGSRAVIVAGRYYSGGWTNTNTSEYVTIATLGNATSQGTMPHNTRNLMAIGNSTTGLIASGEGGDANGIYAQTIASLGTASFFGNLVAANMYEAAGTNSETRALWSGGANTLTNIVYSNIATSGNATTFGTQTNKRSHSALTDDTYAIFAGGGPGTGVAYERSAEYVTIDTLGNTTDFGDLIEDHTYGCATSNGTIGVIIGGEPSGYTNSISYITIASPGNATDFGDLTVAVGSTPAASSGN